mmetsp:Transcript_33809/g.46246  ORF Transcript_33809/g.46246 Transcript_33809/m.46246 type:complete len:275 (+) Transcript_33809:56-880(+)
MLSAVAPDIAPTRRGRVRAVTLTPEAELTRFIKNISTIDPEWKWNSFTPIESWKGVTHNGSCISWAKMSLRGTLQWSFFPQIVEKCEVLLNFLEGQIDITELNSVITVLNLGQNCFSGPVDLTQLPLSLGRLWLTENFLSGKVDLTALAPQLQRLSLSTNKLEGEISLAELPSSLLSLRLDKNMFTGRLDLAHLPLFLNSLDVSENQFDGEISLDFLPPGLRLLDLRSNSLSGIVDVTSLTNKSGYQGQRIDLRDNNFSDILPSKEYLPRSIKI